MNYKLILLILLSGQLSNLFAQTLCGTPSPTELEKNTLLVNYQLFSQNKTLSKQAKITTFKVAIKANVLQASNANLPILNDADIRQIINNANVYLQNINVELYLLDNQINFIKDDKFYELKLAEENDLRKKYDVLNAINIYFVRSVTLPDLSILGGYTNLPNSSASSNRIIYSFFDRTKEDYENLKNKLFLHEIGHYFGLLHTFQDSNHSDISRRELVTRGNSSNCYMTADQLCDTPSDPYERFPNALSLDCSSPLPSYLVDAFGDTYLPPTNNIMSYNRNCGHVFTEQQYQKMQASFSIRFSPKSEYQIVARSPNFIEIDDFEKDVYCMGDSVKINYKLEGLYESNNQISVEVSDRFGKNFRKIDGKKVGNQISFKLTNEYIEGDDYRVRLTASRPETISSISEHFAIKNYATAFMTATQLALNAGETTDLYINFTGSGPWSFNLSDGTSVRNTNQNPYIISKKLDLTTNFSFNSVQNVCGEALKKDGVRIAVVQPQIQTTALSTSTFCKGQNIQLTLTSLGQLATDDQYILQISDSKGNNFTDLPTQTSIFTITAQIPDNQPLGGGFRLKIMTKKSQFFSSPIGPISIIDAPVAPKVNPINLCQNANTNVLGASPVNADGILLRWYAEENGSKPLSGPTINTSKEGVFAYYVSQMNIYGCESKRSKLDVTIKPLPVASMSGDKTIMTGDSALLNVDVYAGEFPVTVTLSDGRDFNVLKNPLTIQVRPKKTTTYALKQVKNVCGVGSGVGSAKIVVMEPLGEENSMDSFVSISPNPTTDKISVRFNSFIPKPLKIIVFDINGRIFEERSLKRIEYNQVEDFDLSGFSTGNYLVRISTENQSFSKKIIVQK